MTERVTERMIEVIEYVYNHSGDLVGSGITIDEIHNLRDKARYNMSTGKDSDKWFGKVLSLEQAICDIRKFELSKKVGKKISNIRDYMAELEFSDRHKSGVTTDNAYGEYVKWCSVRHIEPGSKIGFVKIVKSEHGIEVKQKKVDGRNKKVFIF